MGHMTSQDIVDVITALVPLVAAIGSVVAAIMAYKSKTAINDVHQTVNSRMTELVATTKEAERIKGQQEGAAAVAVSHSEAVRHPGETP